MQERRTKAGWFAFVLVGIFAAAVCLHAACAHAAATIAKRGILIYPERQAVDDMAISGMIRGLPDGAIGYVRYADIASLPRVSFQIHRDENFRELEPGQLIHASGIYLQVLANALGALPSSDLIDATCTDDYRGHYPASYLTQHHPILVFTLDHETTADWSKAHRQRDPGPYFMGHANFVPSFKVLAHEDRPQVPSGIVRLNFTTMAATYGAIAPRGIYSPGSLQQEGFVIARQNCLRCHNQGQYGGEKAGRSWMTLSTWAREQPAYFENYVHDPKAFEMHAKMPGNPEYDKATLDALTAYFRTFSDDPIGSGTAPAH